MGNRDHLCVCVCESVFVLPIQPYLCRRCHRSLVLFDHRSSIIADHPSPLPTSSPRLAIPPLYPPTLPFFRLQLEDAKGYLLTHHSAQSGQLMALSYLHRKGVPIERQDKKGRTPLHWACYMNLPVMVQWLVTRGASIDVLDSELCYPIHWAAIKGNHKAVRALLRVGADKQLEAKDVTGMTPYELAFDKASKLDGGQKRNYMKLAKHIKEVHGPCNWKKRAGLVAMSEGRGIMGDFFTYWAVLCFALGKRGGSTGATSATKCHQVPQMLPVPPSATTCYGSACPHGATQGDPQGIDNGH